LQRLRTDATIGIGIALGCGLFILVILMAG
jgi:hypothetical protein